MSQDSQEQNNRSEATESQSSPPAQDQGSHQDKKTQETSGPKSESEAIDAALGEPASDEAAQAALEGKPAAADVDKGDKGDKGTKDGKKSDKKADAGKKAATDKKDEGKPGDDGKPKAGDKPPEGEQGKKADKPGDEAKKGEDDEEGEDDNADPYAVPDRLQARSTKRWERLVKMAKDGEESKKQAEGYARILQSTGASPDEIGSTLRTLRQIKSGKPEDLREALKVLDRNRAEVAKMLGEEVPGVDLLADYPDLAEKVEKMTLSRAEAVEIANARTTQKRTEETRKRTEANATHQANLKRRVEKAQDDLGAIGAELEGKDMDYSRKVELLKENGTFDWICKNFQPEQWGEAFKHQYNLLGKMPAAPAAGTGAGGAAHQPLRPTGGAGATGAGAPKTDQEAVDRALGF